MTNSILISLVKQISSLESVIRLLAHPRNRPHRSLLISTHEGSDNSSLRKVEEEDDEAGDVVSDQGHMILEDTKDHREVEETDAKGSVIVNDKNEDIQSMSLKLIRKNHECDLLGRQLFNMNQQIKIQTDRINQLESNNTYRSQVFELENILAKKR